MKRKAVGALFVVVVAAVAVRAQTGGATHGDHKMEQMAPDITYVGCVEAGNMPKAFVLTHITAGAEMKPEKKQDREKKKDGMAGDSMDMMTPSIVALHVAPPEVSGHVGHKVSVVGSLEKAGTMMSNEAEGMNHLPTLTVKSVKMVAASCP